MSLKSTLHTQNWGVIPKKCKNCCKAIYTVEDNEVFYQCSIFGTFKKSCTLEVSTSDSLLRPEKILEKTNE